MQIQITISMDDNGKISVNGPIENKLVCYGLLESAKDAIRNYVIPKIQPATEADVARLKSF
jgi:hypothetical protein